MRILAKTVARMFDTTTVPASAAPRPGWPHGEVEGKTIGQAVWRMDCVYGKREREGMRAKEGVVACR